MKYQKMSFYEIIKALIDKIQKYEDEEVTEIRVPETLYMHIMNDDQFASIIHLFVIDDNVEIAQEENGSITYDIVFASRVI